MIRAATLAAALALITSAAHAGPTELQMLQSQCSKAAPQFLAECLYGKTDEEFLDSADRYAHPRSVDQYRHIVPNDDIAGMCRSAGHVKECLSRLHDVNNGGRGQS
jgi:hypothetical protein